MKIKKYTLKDIKKLIIVGKLAANTLLMIYEYIKIGLKTDEVNSICQKYIETKLKCSSATIGYKCYQHATCISKNKICCHGIPSYKKKIKTNDILNIDVTIIKNGYYADTSYMYFVECNYSIFLYNNKLNNISCLYNAMSFVCECTKFSEIGALIQNFAKYHGFSVVKELCGHGIGTAFHLQPLVLNYNGYKTKDVHLKKGMCVTIEPILIQRGTKIKNLNDGWTITTKSKSHSAQWEHTLIINKKGVIITTIRKNEKL
ncbi:type I methionyl aminopeptidase [Candidatus Portiera aleyrodidarum]|uniref:type I methionyl aminopeptidase n=1 Tax=Candidatus Portiera aleyrodidarum TaxID=91844 RepID=UPI000C75D1FC|nr:type I methionyl aminopeptidase [Candidatus Portiera aleyrodidarum]AUI73056.1 type I methionyl aminopeptidase [Candidatus Portiera aleyrodidarum]